MMRYVCEETKRVCVTYEIEINEQLCRDIEKWEAQSGVHVDLTIEDIVTALNEDEYGIPKLDSELVSVTTMYNEDTNSWKDYRYTSTIAEDIREFVQDNIWDHCVDEYTYDDSDYDFRIIK